jgi:lysozyme family protein
LDALALEGFTGQSDWSLEAMLYRWEAFNGFGYRNRLQKVGQMTPYLWSFSNHYRAGKYTADGSFDSKAVSQQCGAAVMLHGLVNAGLVII